MLVIINPLLGYLHKEKNCAIKKGHKTIECSMAPVVKVVFCLRSLLTGSR